MDKDQVTQNLTLYTTRMAQGDIATLEANVILGEPLTLLMTELERASAEFARLAEAEAGLADVLAKIRSEHPELFEVGND